jgi:hypothetical protein
MMRINVAAQLCAVAAVSLSLGALEAQADTILYVSDQNDNIGQVDINTQSVVAGSVHDTGQALTDIGFNSAGNLFGTTFTALMRSIRAPEQPPFRAITPMNLA